MVHTYHLTYINGHIITNVQKLHLNKRVLRLLSKYIKYIIQYGEFSLK